MRQFDSSWEDLTIERSLSRKNRLQSEFSELSRRIAQLKAKARCDSFPTNLERIAKEVGIIAFREVPLDIRGQLIREPRGFAVEVNSELPVSERRFVIAHEISHLLLEDEQLRQSTGRIRRDGQEGRRGYRQTETLCDFGAREILLPLNALRPELRKQAPSLAAIARISTEAECPVWMTVQRVCEPFMLWDCTFFLWKESGGKLRCEKGLPSAPCIIELADERDSVARRAMASPGEVVVGQEQIVVLAAVRSFPCQAMLVDGPAVLMLVEGSFK